MTMCVAEPIVEDGYVNPENLAQRFIAWLPLGRGKGQACVDAVVRLGSGEPWYRAGVGSADNGAAMRVAPVGLRYPREDDSTQQKC
jgi:ADP-ribosylglycohydrolase